MYLKKMTLALLMPILFVSVGISGCGGDSLVSHKLTKPSSSSYVYHPPDLRDYSVKAAPGSSSYVYYPPDLRDYSVKAAPGSSSYVYYPPDNSNYYLEDSLNNCIKSDPSSYMYYPPDSGCTQDSCSNSRSSPKGFMWWHAWGRRSNWWYRWNNWSDWNNYYNNYNNHNNSSYDPHYNGEAASSPYIDYAQYHARNPHETGNHVDSGGFGSNPYWSYAQRGTQQPYSPIDFR